MVRVWFRFLEDYHCVTGDYEFVSDLCSAIHAKLGKASPSAVCLQIAVKGKILSPSDELHEVMPPTVSLHPKKDANATPVELVFQSQFMKIGQSRPRRTNSQPAGSHQPVQQQPRPSSRPSSRGRQRYQNPVPVPDYGVSDSDVNASTATASGDEAILVAACRSANRNLRRFDRNPALRGKDYFDHHMECIADQLQGMADRYSKRSSAKRSQSADRQRHEYQVPTTDSGSAAESSEIALIEPEWVVMLCPPSPHELTSRTIRCPAEPPRRCLDVIRHLQRSVPDYLINEAFYYDEHFKDYVPLNDSSVGSMTGLLFVLCKPHRALSMQLHALPEAPRPDHLRHTVMMSEYFNRLNGFLRGLERDEEAVRVQLDSMEHQQRITLAMYEHQLQQSLDEIRRQQAAHRLDTPPKRRPWYEKVSPASTPSPSKKAMGRTSPPRRESPPKVVASITAPPKPVDPQTPVLPAQTNQTNGAPQPPKPVEAGVQGNRHPTPPAPIAASPLTDPRAHGDQHWGVPAVAQPPSSIGERQNTSDVPPNTSFAAHGPQWGVPPAPPVVTPEKHWGVPEEVLKTTNYVPTVITAPHPAPHPPRFHEDDHWGAPADHWGMPEEIKSGEPIKKKKVEPPKALVPQTPVQPGHATANSFVTCASPSASVSHGGVRADGTFINDGIRNPLAAAQLAPSPVKNGHLQASGVHGGVSASGAPVNNGVQNEADKGILAVRQYWFSIVNRDENIGDAFFQLTLTQHPSLLRTVLRGWDFVKASGILTEIMHDLVVGSLTEEKIKALVAEAREKGILGHTPIGERHYHYFITSMIATLSRCAVDRDYFNENVLPHWETALTGAADAFKQVIGVTDSGNPEHQFHDSLPSPPKPVASEPSGVVAPPAPAQPQQQEPQQPVQTQPQPPAPADTTPVQPQPTAPVPVEEEPPLGAIGQQGSSWSADPMSMKRAAKSRTPTPRTSTESMPNPMATAPAASATVAPPSTVDAAPPAARKAESPAPAPIDAQPEPVSQPPQAPETAKPSAPAPVAASPVTEAPRGYEAPTLAPQPTPLAAPAPVAEQQAVKPIAATTSTPAASSAAPKGHYKERLTAFFNKYCPDMISTIDDTLRRVQGAEEGLFAALVSKYGPEPPLNAAAPRPAAEGDALGGRSYSQYEV